MKKKNKPSKKVSIEFDEKHLGTLATALEVYSRLRSGQIKMAMDTAFWDKELTYQDGEVLESMVRTIVFHKEEELMKNRNSYYGIGCEKMKDGTVAWEIKKTIDQYLHYQRNDGYRQICDVSGAGAFQSSDVPIPKIIEPSRMLSEFAYWKPQKEFRIPQRYQERVDKAMKSKDFTLVWDLVYKAFKKNLPKGSSSSVKEVAGTYYVVITEPYKWIDDER
jgi:hypothetical protein